MEILRNDTVRMEQRQIALAGHLYRVTGSPSIAGDKYAMVEVLRPETMHGHGDRVRFSHWARVPHGKRRDAVRLAVIETSK